MVKAVSALAAKRLAIDIPRADVAEIETAQIVRSAEEESIIDPDAEPSPQVSTDAIWPLNKRMESFQRWKY